MLNLDQVRLLENRVEKAVGRIQSLTAENTLLRTQLTGLQARVSELEGLVRSFKDDQGRIEEGILNALDRLSAFEDSVFNGESKPAAQPEFVAEPEIITPTVETLAETAMGSDEPGEEPAAQDTVNIEADWQESPAIAKSDGQMDIF